MPIVIEMDGSSTWISGSGAGLSGSASVSPIVMSGMPAIATMSPGPASSAGSRSSALVISSSDSRTLVMLPSRLAPGDVLAAAQRAVDTRHSASRPR